MRATPWETNFEDCFEDSDNLVKRLIEEIGIGKTAGGPLSYLLSLLPLFLKRNRELRDVAVYGALNEETDRAFLKYLVLLLLRWPSTRARLEAYSIEADADQRIETGKMNLLTQVRVAKDCLKARVMPLHFYVFLYSPRKEFIAGDGVLNALTSSLTGGAIRGHALLPMTPHICVYVCTPSRIKSDINFASLMVPDWMVEMQHEITMTYSKENVFFRSKAPNISDDFTSNEFRAYSSHQHELLDYLNALVHYGARYRDLKGTLHSRSLFRV